MRTGTPILDVANLSVRFGRTAVLTDVTFHVEAGASLAVIGPNGAGKTVLFRALIDAIPYAGTVRWAPGVRLGYVPQKLDIERDVPITGFDFLQARIRLGRGDVAAASAAARSVGLSIDAWRTPIGELSGGQFQRLLVAFALLGDPTVLLLDEPTAGVDEPGQEQLNELVHRLQQERGLTVLLISHEISVVSRYATQVLCLGRASAHVGLPSEMLTEESLRRMYGTPVAFHSHDH
jgi:zinc transport system ATP-binding protein